VGAELVRRFDRFRELVAVIPIGYFGASTGAAALVAATKRPDVIGPSSHAAGSRIWQGRPCPAFERPRVSSSAESSRASRWLQPMRRRLAVPNYIGQPPPPIAHDPNPTTVMGTPDEPSERFGKLMVYSIARSIRAWHVALLAKRSVLLISLASRNRKFRQRAHERDRARTLALKARRLVGALMAINFHGFSATSFRNRPSGILADRACERGPERPRNDTGIGFELWNCRTNRPSQIPCRSALHLCRCSDVDLMRNELADDEHRK
jgi:hypothetical protein